MTFSFVIIVENYYLVFNYGLIQEVSFHSSLSFTRSLSLYVQIVHWNTTEIILHCCIVSRSFTSKTLSWTFAFHCLWSASKMKMLATQSSSMDRLYVTARSPASNPPSSSLEERRKDMSMMGSSVKNEEKYIWTQRL